MTRKRNYIGIATSAHDPAIAIVNSHGELVFAESSERYLQNKRAWCNPPDDLIRMPELIKKYCDPDIDLIIAGSWQHSFLRHFRFMAFGPFKHFFLNRLAPEQSNTFKSMAAYFNRRAGVNTEGAFKALFPGNNVIYRTYDHHLTHAAAACFSSPFDNALCAVLDGMGEYSAANFYYYEKGIIKKIPGIKSSSGSLGELYGWTCVVCGFEPVKGDEWKVMGLAAYGQLNQEYYSKLSSFVEVDGCRLVTTNARKEVINWFRQIKRKSETPAIEYADFAFTAQYVFGELMDELLTNLSKLASTRNLVLSGGCALNSAYVGTIQYNTPFKNCYVFCAPADDGNAVGAAWLSYHQDYPTVIQSTTLQSPYLGSTISKVTLERLCHFGGMVQVKQDDIFQATAKLIAEGKIVGWVQGRAEFGPRALGNRSILADPRQLNIKDKINALVKFREEFRPFAPSILHEFGPTYFDNYQETPYMERALKFKEEVKHQIPGVVHIDGTGRLQSVRYDYNPKYYNLIKAFHELTGIPILLNTSFNVMGKPIIHSIEDAIAVFMTSGLDVLVIEDKMFVKNQTADLKPLLA